MKYSYPALPYFLDYRLSLPRLVHFLDLVLPQMHPHQQVREHNDIRQLTSHYLSLHGHDGSRCHPPLHMNFLFHSHAGLVHVLVEWYRHPLLVFSDYPKVEGVSLEALRSATTLEIYRQHVAFGIRARQSTLFAFETQGNLYIMVGILIASNVPPTASKENRHWKHVAPHQTELAILPRAMAETFCRHALAEHPNYHYLHDWHRIFSPTEGGRVQLTMHHIELLGDTRSADDLGVFCTMPHEAYEPMIPWPHRERDGYIRGSVHRQVVEPPLRMLEMLVLSSTSSLTSRTAGLSCGS